MCVVAFFSFRFIINVLEKSLPNEVTFSKTRHKKANKFKQHNFNNLKHK